MDATSRETVFRFEAFRLERRSGLSRLHDTGQWEPVMVGSRALDVLTNLVQRRGELATKRDLMDAAWPGTAVEDGNLTVQIATLRRILDDARAGGSCIQTVIGRGYRFVAPVTRLEAPARDPSDARPAAHSPQDRRQSVVVLPFENSSGDPTQDGIAAGITRDVTTDSIAQSSMTPFVPAVTAATRQGKQFDPHAIGHDQNVHFVLTGDARQRDGRLIVAATLYQTEDGWPVWSRRYDCPDRPDARIHTILSIVVNVRNATTDAEVARAMREHPDSLDKRDLYLAAYAGSWSQLSKEKYLERIAFAERALALDPDYVPALEIAARVRAFLVLGGYSTDPNFDLSRAAKQVDRALLLAPDDYWVLVAKANVLRAQGHLHTAAALFRKVIGLRPARGASYKDLGRVLLPLGHFEEALERFETAKQLALGSEPAQLDDMHLAIAFVANGRYPEAIAQARLAIAEFSSGSGRDAELPWLALIAAESQNGQDEDARANLRSFLGARRLFCNLAEFKKSPIWATSPNLLEGLRRAGMPEE